MINRYGRPSFRTDFKQTSNNIKRHCNLLLRFFTIVFASISTLSFVNLIAQKPHASLNARLSRSIRNGQSFVYFTFPVSNVGIY